MERSKEDDTKIVSHCLMSHLGIFVFNYVVSQTKWHLPYIELFCWKRLSQSHVLAGCLFCRFISYYLFTTFYVILFKSAGYSWTWSCLDGHMKFTFRHPCFSFFTPLECKHIYHPSSQCEFFEIIEFFTIGVPVRLSDRSLHREEQKKIHQKFPPVGIETRTSGSWDQWSYQLS